MSIFPTAGAKLYIGGVIDVTDDVVEADFSGETWVEVKPMEALGSIGDEAAPVEFTEIGKARVQRLKGPRSAPDYTAVAGIDYADAGQIAVLAAEKTQFNYAFRIVFNDAPPAGTPSERMFGAIVGSAVEQLDTADSVMKLAFALWVNTNIVRINAAAA